METEANIDAEDEPPGSPLIRESNIGNFLDKENMLLKYEGANPTGTQKDRISRKHVENAISKGYDRISVATCGNYGASIAYYAEKYGIKAIIGIPSDYSNIRYDEIKEYNADIIEKPLKYEEMVEYIRDLSNKNNWYDASPGSKNKKIDIEGYSEIAYEIYNQLSYIPDYISIPVGNGTTLYGIYRGFYDLYKNNRTDKIPEFIASSTVNGNPIIDSFLNDYKKIHEINPENIMETEINEPLVSYRSYDGQNALNVLYKTGGKAVYVTDDEMYELSRDFKKYDDLSVLPASTAAVAAALRIVDDETCVIVLTGSDKIWKRQ